MGLSIERQEPAITALDWVMVALSAQRNVKRIYGGTQCHIAGSAGLNVLREAIGAEPTAEGWYAAIATAAEFVVDQTRNPLDEWSLLVRLRDRGWHQGAPYDVRGMQWLDLSARCAL